MSGVRADIICRGQKIGTYVTYGRDTWQVRFNTSPQNDYIYILKPKNRRQYQLPNNEDLRLMMCHLYEEAAPPTADNKRMSQQGLDLYEKYGYVISLEIPIKSSNDEEGAFY